MNSYIISKFDTLNIYDDIINNNNDENFPFFWNKNELFFYDLNDKKEKIEIKEINPISMYDQTKKEINNSNDNNKNCKTIFSIQKNTTNQNLSKKINGINKFSYEKTGKKENQNNNYNISIFVPKAKKDKIYRKDYYYKHFKAIFGKYLRNRVNNLKNKCFPNFIYNNFSTPHYSFIGNVKEIDNYHFLFWQIKEIFAYKEEKKEFNRQYNNRLLIDYILKNKNKNKDKEAYQELIFFLNSSLENAFLDFYENKKELEKLTNDEDCIFYDKFFKNETGISLLEKKGFLKIIQKR